MNRLAFRVPALCAVMILMGAAPSWGIDKDFNGLAGVDWYAPSAWTPAGAPTDEDRAILNGSTVFPDVAFLSSGAHIDELVIASFGAADLRHSAGLLTIDNDVYMGNADGQGLWTMSGTAHAEARNVYVGVAGGGFLTLGGDASLTARLVMVSAGGRAAGNPNLRRVIQNGSGSSLTLVPGDGTGELNIGQYDVGTYSLNDGIVTTDKLLIGSGDAVGVGTFTLTAGFGAAPKLVVNSVAHVGGGMASGVTGTLNNGGGMIQGDGEIIVHGAQGRLYGVGAMGTPGGYDIRVTFDHNVDIKFARDNLTTAAILSPTVGLTGDSGTGDAATEIHKRSASSHHVNWGGPVGPADIAYRSVVPAEVTMPAPTPSSATRPTIEVPLLDAAEGTADVAVANIKPRMRLMQLGQDILDPAHLNGSAHSTTGNKAGQIRNITTAVIDSDTRVAGQSQNVAGEFDLAVIGKAVTPKHQNPQIAALHVPGLGGRPKLTGAGVLMGQIEPGLPCINHGAFDDWSTADTTKSRIQLSGSTFAPGTSDPHSTYVASVMIGYDPLGLQVDSQSQFEPLGNRYNGGFGFTGVAPGARLYSRLDTNSPTFADLLALAATTEVVGGKTNAMKVINMSAGYSPPGGASGTNTEELVIDQLVESNQIVFVKSAGNNGDSSPPGTPQYTTITVPGGNYNGITVGNAEFDAMAGGADNAYPQHFDIAHATVDSSSSRGPTPGMPGRSKPDLVAQGTGGLGAFTMEEYNTTSANINSWQYQIDPAYPEEGNRGLYSTEGRKGEGARMATATSPPSPAGSAGTYAISADVAQSGTSFAAPVVAGVAALMVEQARKMEHPTEAEDPRVIKSVLQTSAVKPGGWEKGVASLAADNTTAVPLSYDWGAGLLDPEGAVNLLRKGPSPKNVRVADDGWNLAAIGELDANRAEIGLLGHFYFFDDLVAGTDFTATLNWYRHISASGGALSADALVNFDLILYPWNGTTLGVAEAISESTVDNLEHIFLDSIVGGDYMLRVVGRDYAGRASETYALSWEITSSAPLVPEPGTFLLAGIGGLCLIRWNRKTCRKKKSDQV